MRQLRVAFCARLIRQSSAVFSFLSKSVQCGVLRHSGYAGSKVTGRLVVLVAGDGFGPVFGRLICDDGTGDACCQGFAVGLGVLGFGSLAENFPLLEDILVVLEIVDGETFDDVVELVLLLRL